MPCRHIMARLYGCPPWKWIAPALGVGVGAAYNCPLKGKLKGPLKGVYGHLKDQMAVMRSCKTTFHGGGLAPPGADSDWGYP